MFFSFCELDVVFTARHIYMRFVAYGIAYGSAS